MAKSFAVPEPFSVFLSSTYLNFSSRSYAHLTKVETLIACVAWVSLIDLEIFCLRLAWPYLHHGCSHLFFALEFLRHSDQCLEIVETFLALIT